LAPSIKAALTRRCPKCRKGRLLSGFLEAAPSCSSCELDLTPYDAGDGPAFLVILLAGAIGSVALMLLVFEAAAWSVIAVAISVTLGLTFGLLPVLKCFLITEAWTRKGVR